MLYLSRFSDRLANNAAVLKFLLETLQLISPVIKTMKTRGSLISDTVFYTDQQSEMQYFQTLSYNNTPLRTTATIMVSEVAQLMAEMRVNSAVVCEANVP
jgi:CBS domain-containing protein